VEWRPHTVCDVAAVSFDASRFVFANEFLLTFVCGPGVWTSDFD